MNGLPNETLSMLNGIFEAARLLPARAAKRDVLPLTIISGFLGAGKTTLLNNLLSDPQGRQLAVLVNDFGSINVDAALIKARNDAAISLTNGCVCCTVAGDLTKALMRLADSPNPPDAIILEASGLADPRGIAQVALTNPALYLDGVLTVVDGDTFEDRHDDPDFASIFSAQLSAADIIVLNKIDLLDEERGGAVRAHLRESNDRRPVLEVTHAKVPADVILGVRTQRSIAIACLPDEDHGSAFQSWSRVWSAPLEKDRLIRALERLPTDIVRGKGIFHFSNNPFERFVYQRVGQRWKLTPDVARDAIPESSLVVIGVSSKFDADAVAACFDEVIPI